MGKIKALKKAKTKDDKKPPVLEKTENENPFEFGGLPDRNLKKNLGCG
jgi:hypothetical protein